MMVVDRRSPEAEAYRKLYKGKRWQILRTSTFVRDKYTCKMCGKMALKPICDHVKPHKGDEKLFFDQDNTQTLCPPCHDKHKQSFERIGFSKTIGSDGWPTDPLHPSNR